MASSPANDIADDNGSMDENSSTSSTSSDGTLSGADEKSEADIEQAKSSNVHDDKDDQSLSSQDPATSVSGSALLSNAELDQVKTDVEKVVTRRIISKLIDSLRNLGIDEELQDELDQRIARVNANERVPSLKRTRNFTQLPRKQNKVDRHGNENGHHRHPNGREIKELKPEAWKAVVAMLYFFVVTWITAIVMVVVHDRVPDMQSYPPLPDLFLDNVPMIPWAFTMCELCGLILFIIWCKILIFHKHRFILLRRMFSLFGSVFLLRCVTMLITSLSVPGRHLECKARPYGNWKEKLIQAYVIWQGGGMSIKGVRTCGDYMFSGHTVVLTLLNFFITEYTPPSMYYLHTTSWVLNLFGIFFILAGHEHYSIDVFIAFYISTRLFLYYHTLANNRALYQQDRKRTRIWFPLFYFFESGINGIVPNHFDLKLNLRSVARRWKNRTWLREQDKSKKSV